MTVFTLDALLVSTLLGTVLPILVGLVTKLNAASWVKGVSLLFLSAVTGLISTSTTLDGTAVFSKESLILALIAWVTAVATYFGLLKPAEVTAVVQERTANVGVG